MKETLIKLNYKDKDIYIATEIRSLNDIMAITNELSSSDYFIFIDFKRKIKKNNKLPISLFSHQELALARQLGFGRYIGVFKEKGTPTEGFLKYIQCRTEEFKNKEDLIVKVEKLAKQWDISFSRNLIVTDISLIGPLEYFDTLEGCRTEIILHAEICNNRQDEASFETICILDKIKTPKEVFRSSSDRGYLKWAKHNAYSRIIFPKDFAKVDIFSVRAGNQGIYIHSTCDMKPREPVASDDGRYTFFYKLFSLNFPSTEFLVEFDYKWNSFDRKSGTDRMPIKNIKLISPGK